jgi:hypothetical protein
VGLTLIQASDYVFGTGDKGMTFGASTVNSVHIQTIASDGMAARLFGQDLRVGCIMISIDGRRISGETHALKIMQAHATQDCVLTLSVQPTDNITWINDVNEMTLPSVGPDKKIPDPRPAADHVQTSTPSTATGIIGPQELTAPAASASNFECNTTSIMEQQQISETDDYNIKAPIAVSSSNSAANPISDSNSVSETSIIQGGKQSRTITDAFGVAQTIVVDLDEVRQMMQTCFPAAIGVDPPTDSRVLNSWISLRNLSTSMSDNAGHQMG